MRTAPFLQCFAVLLSLLFWASAALAERERVRLPETVPMPEMRPAEAPRPLRLLEIPQAEIEAAAKLCRSVLDRNKLVAEPAQAALWNNGCGAVGQVRISAIKLASGRTSLCDPPR